MSSIGSGKEVANAANSATRKSMVNTALQKAVDWKLFELSLQLIEPNVPSSCELDILTWFQEHHYEEVMEERITNCLCGYIFCGNALLPSFPAMRGGRSKPSSTVVPEESSQGKYRIDYREKQIFEVGQSARFCQMECMEKAEVLRKQLDETSVYMRPAAKKLILQSNVVPSNKKAVENSESNKDAPGRLLPVQSNASIDEILALMNHRPATANIASTSPSKIDIREDNQPPLYSNSALSEYGEVNHVQFNEGQPVIVKPEGEENQDTEVRKEVLPTPTPVIEEEKKEEEDEEDDDPNAVYMPSAGSPPKSAPSPTKAASPDAKSVPASAPSGENVDDIMRNLKSIQLKYANKPIVYTPKKPVSKSGESDDASTIASTASSKGLRSRRVVSTTSPGKSPVEPVEPTPSPNKVERPNVDINPEDDEASANNKLLNVLKEGEVGLAKKQVGRRVRKSVEWNLTESNSQDQAADEDTEDESEEEEEEVAKVAEVQPPTSAKASSNTLPPKPAGKAPKFEYNHTESVGSINDTSNAVATKPKSILKTSSSAPNVSAANVSATGAQVKTKKPTSVIGMTISERINATPLSSAAILTKREPNTIEGYVPKFDYK